MQRGNGAVIGKQNTPTASVATGVWALNEVQRAVLNGTWPPFAASDPYFENVTMLLHGDGTNGAQNNTFLDSSTNNFTITRNGNTTQGTFSPYGSNWSNYFDGTGDYISAAYNSAFAMNTYATFECWVNFSALSSDRLIFGKDGFWLNYSYTGIGTTASKIGFSIYNGSSWTTVSSTTTPQVGQWIHIAGVRDNTTLRIYINGIQEATTSFSSSPVVSSFALSVGGNAADGAGVITGYISNARYCNGATSGALPYTGNFTPSTTPLSATASTVFLSCQSNRFIDNSTNAFTITRNGDTSVQRFSPFNPTAPYAAGTDGGSGYFDGTGDYLVLPDNAALEPGSSNLTWETWINTTNSTQYATLYSRTTASFSTGMWSLMMNVASSTTGDVALYVGDFNALSPLLQTTGVSVRDGAWHHIAVVRNGSAWTIYVDGVSRATATWAGTIADISGGPYIGRDQFYGRDYTGYMTDLRVLKGTAQYTAAFTPPSAPLTAVTNTSLLCNFTNAGILDNAEMNNLETVGNAQISTAQSKFGGGSIAFDGTGDYLTFPANNTLQFGTGDFTIEFWTYLNSVTGFQMFIDNRNSTLSSAAYITIYSSGTSLIFYTTGNDRITATSALSTGAWLHIAVSKSSGSTKMFVNGSQVGSTYSDANSYLAASTPQYIASRVSAADFNLNGYIDDLRITNGYARYTANFTPPTAPFPDF